MESGAVKAVTDEDDDAAVRAILHTNSWLGFKTIERRLDLPSARISAALVRLTEKGLAQQRSSFQGNLTWQRSWP